MNFDPGHDKELEEGQGPGYKSTIQLKLSENLSMGSDLKSERVYFLRFLSKK